MKWDCSNQKGKKILVSEQKRNYFLNADDITYILCDGYVSTFYITDETKKYPTSRLLKHIEKELEQYGGFIRINRNTLINARYLSSSWTEDKVKYILVHKKQFKVSKRNAHLFRKDSESA